MKVPSGIVQLGLAMKKKLNEHEQESVEELLAREAKQERRRKPAAVRKPRQAESLARPVSPEPPPEPVTTAAEPPPEPLVYIAPDPDLHPASGVWVAPPLDQMPADFVQIRYCDSGPFGDTPPRDVSRPALVAFAVDIIRQEGPQSTNALLNRAFPGISADDRAALRQKLPKWLMAEYREADPSLTGRRYRAKEGNEKRENLFGFWPEPRQGKSRRAVDVAEVLTAIAELKAELVTLRQVQSELLQRQNLLKEGVAAMLEKLTWNGER